MLTLRPRPAPVPEHDYAPSGTPTTWCRRGGDEQHDRAEGTVEIVGRDSEARIRHCDQGVVGQHYQAAHHERPECPPLTAAQREPGDGDIDDPEGHHVGTHGFHKAHEERA